MCLPVSFVKKDFDQSNPSMRKVNNRDIKWEKIRTGKNDYVYRSH